ncbi:dynein axonemal heavy chain 3 [Tachysurus ichikawai]
MEDDSMRSIGSIEGLSHLPESSCQVASYLHQKRLFPPLLESSRWTQVALSDDQRQHRTPSECIANNYSPQTRHLKITHLQPTHYFRCSAPSEKRVKPTCRLHREAVTSVSHPLAPEQQLAIMKAQEELEKKYLTEPTPTELEVRGHNIYLAI